MDFRWIFNLKIRGVDFSKMFRGFTESGRNNTTPQGKQNTFGERSERSERSDSSVRKHLLQDFWGDSRKPPKRTRQRRTNNNNYTRFPFPYLDRFMLGGVFEPDALKTLQDCPRRAKTRPRRAKTPPRRAKTRPRRAQDAPRHAKTRPRRAKTPQDAPKTRLRSIFNDF